MTSNKGEIDTRVLQRKSRVEGVGWDYKSSKIGGGGEDKGKEREEDGALK